MKKVKLLTFALSCSLLLGAGISSFTSKNNQAKVEEIAFTTKGQYELKETFSKLAVAQDVSEIKYLVSIDGTKALLATAFNETIYNQVGAASQTARQNPVMGYDVNGTEIGLTNTVYEGIRTNNGEQDKVWRSEDIFGAEYENYYLTVAEMDYDPYETYEVESFARVGENKIVSKERTFGFCDLPEEVILHEMDASTCATGLDIINNSVTTEFDSAVAYGEENGSMKVTHVAEGESYILVNDIAVTDISLYNRLSFRVYNDTDHAIKAGTTWCKDTTVPAGEWAEVTITTAEWGVGPAGNVTAYWSGNPLPKTNINGFVIRLMGGWANGDVCHISNVMLYPNK